MIVECDLIVFVGAGDMLRTASRRVTLVTDPYPGMRLLGVADRAIIVSHFHVITGVEPGITIWGTLERPCASLAEARVALGEGWMWGDDPAGAGCASRPPTSAPASP